MRRWKSGPIYLSVLHTSPASFRHHHCLLSWHMAQPGWPLKASAQGSCSQCRLLSSYTVMSVCSYSGISVVSIMKIPIFQIRPVTSPRSLGVWVNVGQTAVPLSISTASERRFGTYPSQKTPPKYKISFQPGQRGMQPAHPIGSVRDEMPKITKRVAPTPIANPPVPDQEQLSVL